MLPHRIVGARAAPPARPKYQVVVQNVKHHNKIDEIEFWQAQHKKAIERSRGELDEFTYLFVMSRYHRVGGFIPQIRRQKQPMIDEMDLAEKYALDLPQSDEIYRTAAGEVLYPVLESRTKEALWLGDHDLALERIQRAVNLSPYDARAWLQLGDVFIALEKPEQALAAYRRAGRLAPPGREIAWFMAGQCYEVLDDLESACDAYLASLQADPLGISAAERLVDVASQLNNTALSTWIRLRLEHLTAKQRDAAATRSWPYKHLPPPIPNNPA